MNRLRRPSRFWLALLLAANPAFARPSPPLTYTQLGTLPPEELCRRLLGEMSQILYLYPSEGRASVPFPGPGRPSRLDFLSRPRAAEAAGICETDLVSVSYDLPVEAGILDPPIRLLGMSVTTLSFIHDLPLARRGDAALELAFAEGLEGVVSIRVLPLRSSPPEAFRRNNRDAPAPAIR